MTSVIYSYADLCGKNHNDTIIKTSEDFFKKNIPLTLFVSFACERKLETEQRLQHIDRSNPSGIAVCRSRSPDAQPEARGLSFLLAFSTTSRL